MELHISPASFGMRPKVQLPNPRILEYLKEEGIRKLVNDHYDLLSKSEIKHLFPPTEGGLELAKLRSSDFFIQICGGRAHYNENQGKPMLTKRHSPFKITAKGRIVWMQCYQQILPKLDIPEELIMSFWNYLDIFSMWMINDPDEN